MATVLGIGVAVMTSTCGRLSAALARSASRCSTPNRCCSSMTTRPRSANWTRSSSSAWVPITIPASPVKTSDRAARRAAAPDRPGQQGHAGGVLRAAQLPALGQRAEHVGDRPVVLLGQDLGRGQQGGLAARVDHLEHGPDRDHRLARADLALQQPVHRVGAGQVVSDGLAHRHLARGEGERQPGVELVGQAAVDVRPRHGRQGGGGHPPLGQGGLQDEGLVPLQAQPGPVPVRPVERPVDGPDGLGLAVQPVPVPQRRGQRIFPGLERLQDGLDRLGR